MSKPIKIKALRFDEVIQDMKQKNLEAQKKLKENKGRCIKCNKNMANINSPTNPFHCNNCNKETENRLKQLYGLESLEIKSLYRKKLTNLKE